jgi:hypothetical protein
MKGAVSVPLKAGEKWRAQQPINIRVLVLESPLPCLNHHVHAAVVVGHVWEAVQDGNYTPAEAPLFVPILLTHLHHLKTFPLDPPEQF